jgi:glycosyltransferase involved in cell wall biosynthesis
LRARFGIERFALLTLARLVPVKGLVEAARALAARGDLEWLIAGDGPERTQLEAIARTAQLRVRLLGAVRDSDKSDLLHAADAFVLPSRVLPSGRSEGAPTALLEAMLAGLPVIASEVGGIGEVLAAGARGSLFDPTAAGALEATVDRMRASLPSEREARVRAAREFAQRQTWAALAPRIDACLLPASAIKQSTAPREADEGERDHQLQSDQPERTLAVLPGE